MSNYAHICRTSTGDLYAILDITRPA